MEERIQKKGENKTDFFNLLDNYENEIKINGPQYGDLKNRKWIYNEKTFFIKEKNIMRSRKGFTLIELMVVVLIVAVLAAVLIPLMQARLEAARWSEGKAGCGTIATAVRAMAAEVGFEDGITMPIAISDYVTAQDMQGKYFTIANYSFTVEPALQDASSDYPVYYTVQVASDDTDLFPTVASWELDHEGTWTRTER
ncbi:MAG: prepilin-type N-terminal cleavage/methylation domain-containing protein [Sedimentisphaerales bacterium]|nr:prepilin-type N-terminal cleavage/methylation domain-containing protein [Sedimentisphaerales bacterium]